MKFVKSYKDSKRIYFLLEYIKGLSLYSVMRHVGLFSNNDAIFYTASIVLVLEYLHERDIIYRDLKPENIILDAEGFIKLIDFGTSKILQGRTYTLVGTPFYLAPEVIVGRGYTKSADLWSLGIIIFEFLCGKVPFGHFERDPYRIYEAILSNDLHFPDDVPHLSDPAINLIKMLLNKFSESRLNDTIDKIKNSEWLNGVDWEDLYCTNLVAPYKPTTKNEEDEYDEFTNENENNWDFIIDNESSDKSSSESEIVDEEIKEYKETIPHNWDHKFG